MAKKRRHGEFRERLDELDLNEKQKLYKQARKMRRASRGRGPKGRHAASDDSDEEVSRIEKMSPVRGESLDHHVEQLLDGVSSTEVAFGETTGTREGVVVQLTAGRCQVEEGDLRLSCRIPDFLSSSVIIGDRVLYLPPGEAEEGSIEAVLPRRTYLSRRDPAVPQRAKLVAANVDCVVIVAAVQNPPLRPRLIDRYLIAIRRGGAEALIVVNKCDLVSAEAGDPLEVLDPYRRIGIPIVLCSARERIGIEELRRSLERQTVAFVGHSGVGKSSLISALDPTFELATREVTAHAGKGTHTTTASTLYRIEPEIRVIDTPGIREFGLTAIGRDELREHFAEFDRFAPSCKFGDCAHDHEPHCAVRLAVEVGEISVERFETYRRLLGEL